MEFNDDHVPYSPPFTARIANLSYDTDEEQVKECFERARLKVTSNKIKYSIPWEKMYHLYIILVPTTLNFNWFCKSNLKYMTIFLL